MEEPTSARELFKGRHFDHEVIVLCVRWYLTFKLSSRDLVQMMAERGIVLAHTTILRSRAAFWPLKICKASRQIKNIHLIKFAPEPSDQGGRRVARR